MSSQSLLIGLSVVAGFAAGGAYLKILGKPDASIHNPTVAPTVNNTIHDADSSSNTSSTTTVWSDDKTRDFIETQKDIIKFAHSEQKKLSTKEKREKLLSRAMPNQGLKHTFGAHNAFTTYELKIADKFNALARMKLQKALSLKSTNQDGDWTSLIGYMRSALDDELSRSDEVVNLAELIQFLTLKISLLYLFGQRPGLENREAVKYVAKTINILWIRSKAFRTNADFAAVAEQMWEHEYRLRHHLRTITGANPDDSIDSIDNPLNLILPAYETMWRAVSKGVLEVYFRDAPDANKWKELLFRFLNNPIRNEFKHDGEKRGLSPDLSPLDIMKEVFRIYPPTRHVYCQMPNEPPGQFAKADIETCHRLRFLAQSDPEWFRPERWLEIKRRYEEDEKEKAEADGKQKEKAEANEKQDENNEQQAGTQTPQAEKKEPRTLKRFEEELGFMPFAMICPAGEGFTQGFGIKFAALLIASISEAFDKLNEKDTWKLEAESPNDVLPALGQALRPNREDYLSLVYRKVIDGSKESGELPGQDADEGDQHGKQNEQVEEQKREITRHDTSQSDRQEEHIDKHVEQNGQVEEQKNDNTRAS